MTDARTAKHAAIDRVQRRAEPDFLAEAASALRIVATYRDTLTTDHVRVYVNAEPHEPRAWGAVMRAGRRDGLIEPTNEYRESSRATCHGRPMRVWRSLVYAVKRAA